jgi:hypothetical protein
LKKVTLSINPERLSTGLTGGWFDNEWILQSGEALGKRAPEPLPA